EISGSLAIAEQSGSFDPARVTTTIAADGTLQGVKRYVIEGDAVDEVVVVAREPGTTGDDGVRAVVVPVVSTRTERARTFDGSRRIAHINLDGVQVDSDRILGEGAGAAAALRRAIEEATVALALEIVGTAQTIFDV